MLNLHVLIGPVQFKVVNQVPQKSHSNKKSRLKICGL